LFGDVVVRDVGPARGDQHGPTDRDAARHRQAEELETHGIHPSSGGWLPRDQSTMHARVASLRSIDGYSPSPNLSSKSVRSAVIAASASSPSVSISTSAPRPAAS